MNRKNRWMVAGMTAALVALLFGLQLVLQQKTAAIPAGDPDRYYHLALARETVQAGKLWLAKLPQFVGLGWERQFPDKEFLFHLISRGLYAVGGDAGVLMMAPIVSSLIVLALMLLLSPSAGAGVAAILVGTGFVLDPYLLTRFGMLRPHVLGVFCFVILLHALTHARAQGLKRWGAALVFAACALYTWSYHSFYVPLVVLGSYLLAGPGGRPEWRERARIAGWGGMGLLTGIIANPHFPGNLDRDPLCDHCAL